MALLTMALLTKARGMMALCCNSPHPAVRLAAARHLGVLATACVPKFEEWGMALLRGQLSDGDPLVREAAHAEQRVESDVLGLSATTTAPVSRS